MPTYQSTYLVAAMGYSGRVPFSSTSVSYFVPLIDTATVTVSNTATGDPTNYDHPAAIKFPLLFQVAASAACRLRQRTVHPQVSDLTTATLFTRMTGSAGYTDVPASTDLTRNATLVTASVADGTTSLATRVFDAIGTNNYGSYIPANTIVPIVVNSLRDCWLQITARDSAGTGTTGELIFTCISDLAVVGY